MKVDNHRCMRTVLDIVGSRIMGVGCEVEVSWIM